MDLYPLALFFHIVGALLLFVLLTIEGALLGRAGMAARMNRILGPISALFVLVPGLYMTATQWGFRPWILVGLATYVLIAALGAFTGITVLRGRMSLDVARGSWLVRVGAAVGIVFDMSLKPDWAVAIAAVGVGTIAGLAAGRVIRAQVQSI